MNYKHLRAIAKNARFASPMPFSEPDSEQLVGKATYPRCGDKMQLAIRLSPDNPQGEEVIKDISHWTRGCTPTVAAAELFCQQMVGQPLKSALQLSYQKLDQDLGGLVPAKRHALVMVAQCLASIMTSLKGGE